LYEELSKYQIVTFLGYVPIGSKTLDTDTRKENCNADSTETAEVGWKQQLPPHLLNMSKAAFCVRNDSAALL